MQGEYQSASSIGRIGEPVFDRHNDRVKGFCTTVLEHSDGAMPFIEQARIVRDWRYASRITLRFVTRYPLAERTCLASSGIRKPNCFSPLGNFYSRGFETEYIPLSGEWQGYGVQYFGENSARRIEQGNAVLKEDEIVFESLRTATSRDPFSKASERGYVTELGIRSDGDIRQLFRLYQAVYRDYVFPLTEENVAELVETPTSIVALARHGSGSIVSVAIAEIAEIETSRGLLRISELSDEATDPSHRSNGLNQACVATLVNELLGRYGNDIHLIFEEDRACSRGVNQQSANLGFRYAGRLNRHCRIDADRDVEVEGPYEDLNVWFLPR
ncbi:MAG: hypothetical protein HYW26_00705 [Candidatus Aenigmarchaeota archaeon]|nr:hypothetical protein [Candidatus Aenigmarchaeota archaeon]